MIRVFISGGIREGKSTVAVAIHQKLVDLGFNVALIDDDSLETSLLKQVDLEKFAELVKEKSPKIEVRTLPLFQASSRDL